MEQENLLQTEDLQQENVQSSAATSDETQADVSVQEQPTPVEKKPEKEVPKWDFTTFDSEEIITRMKELIQDFPVQQLKVLDNLPPIFES